jgi:hypothetical protein
MSASLSLARAFVADLGMGGNVERDAAEIATAADFAAMRAAGFTHVRLFPYSNAGLGFFDSGRMARYYDACAAANAAGLKVLFALQDVCADVDMQNAGTEPYVRRCVADVAARNFDPAKFALCYVNELALKTNNPNANLYNAKYLPILRTALPNHILTVPSAYWSHPDYLTDGTLTVLRDPGCIYEWHWYNWQAGDAATWQAMARKVAAWATARGVVALNAEFGPDVSAATAYDTFPAMIRAYSEGGACPGTVWCATTHDWFRINRSPTDLTLRDDVATALRVAEGYRRGRLAGFTQTKAEAARLVGGMQLAGA